jgi:class 3 adenylate cyclase
MDKSAEFLESLSVNKLEFAILSIDIKDSSVLSNKLDADVYLRMVDAFTFEVAGLVPKFHGQVLKYMGDGLIAYFPAPSFIVKNDLAMECSLAMRKLVYLGLNPVFAKVALPNIDIRIGLDSGEAYVRAIGNPSAKRHMDIIGEVVNIATKVQSICDVGGVALGEETYRNLHTSWRNLCTELELPQNWKYRDSDGKPYRVFKVQFKQV